MARLLGRQRCLNAGIAKGIDLSGAGAHDQVAIRCRQTASLPFDLRLPHFFPTCAVEADHFVLTADKQQVARKDQGGLVWRFKLPLHPGVVEGLGLLGQARRFIFLSLVVETLGFVAERQFLKGLLFFRHIGESLGVIRAARGASGAELVQLCLGRLEVRLQRLQLFRLRNGRMLPDGGVDLVGGHLPLVSLPRSLGVLDAINGRDAFPIRHVAHVARERHLSPTEPAESCLPLVLVHGEDLMLSDGVNLIIGQESLRASDLAARIAAPTRGWLVLIFARLAVERGTKRAPGRDEERVLTREEIALR